MALLKFSGWYSIPLVKKHSRKIFIFGDNLERVGRGGQAIIRHCPNVLGVATKMSPTNEQEAFFWERSLDRHILGLMSDLNEVDRVASLSDLIVPVTEDGHISLGLGLARLDETSPTTYRLICGFFEALAEKQGGWRVFEG